MDKRELQKQQILQGLTNLFRKEGPPLPSYSQVADNSGISRQLIRYYFEEPDDLMCETCDLLADAYRMALVNGVDTLEGPKRLQFIFDFYFDLVDEFPKPRDDQSYDAIMAYAAGSARIRNNLRGQYALVGQVLQLELKMVYPDLDLEDCAEIGYLFVCIMYGHWKMVRSLGVSEDHKLIARRSIDRIIKSYADHNFKKAGSVRIWET